MRARLLLRLFILLLWAWGADRKAWGVESAGASYRVSTYEVAGYQIPPTNTWPALFARYTGTNIGISEIVGAASELQANYSSRGYSNLTVAVARDRIAHGYVRLNVFRGRYPQILISGKRYDLATNLLAVARPHAASDSKPAASPPRGFKVRAYEIQGDTLLSTDVLSSILEKHTGTNVTIAEIVRAASELQMEYRDRGFPTVTVTIPEQQLTNDLVKIRVFQGRLADVLVVGNHYFSSNNVVRALPSLRTNTILNGPIFQAELDRANANQDRQIYPELQPGPAPNTTELVLKVKDRLPLHAKTDFNNQSSPGTPELRLNSSALYDNLWQLDHSIGVQYSFSPEAFKQGNQWDFYDLPLVANYSAFYRLPLSGPEAVGEEVAASAGSFGYDEATRRFRLPPASGRPELNVFASRSTIDTGLMSLSDRIVTDIPGSLTIREQDVQQDLTVNGDLGWRLNLPAWSSEKLQSTFSGGLDYKTYELTSSKTNDYFYISTPHDPVTGAPLPPVITEQPLAISSTPKHVDYLPLSLRYDARLRDPWGLSVFGLGLGGNAWFSGSRSNLQQVTGSPRSTGNWFALNPRFARDFEVRTNWVLALRAEGQWTTEPLMSNEQFGVGGVNSVRGYREGEVFGDTGWWVSLEQKTPPHVVGPVFGKNLLTLRGSVYVDYGEAYLLDPNGRDGHVQLWGMGFGGAASIGPHWEARLLFSWPLLRTLTTQPGQPRFDFGLTAQF